MSLNELYTLKVCKCKSYKKKIIFFNDYQLSMLNLIPKKVLTLQVGAAKIKVEVAKLNSHSNLNSFYLSSKAFSLLPFYQGQPLLLVFLSNDRLVLGPSVGLTLSKKTWRNIKKSSVNKKRALLALEKGILFYCFRLKNADWEKNIINAYCLNPTTKK